jgi:hypothetical protein
MTKQPRAESKGRRAATSNKQKREALRKKREAKARKEARLRRTERVDFAAMKGAIAADLSQQVPNNSYAAKPLYYVDQPFACKDCGKEEVWTAAQQKWYYEVAKGSLYGGAVRCRACRKKRKPNRPSLSTK